MLKTKILEGLRLQIKQENDFADAASARKNEILEELCYYIKPENISADAVEKTYQLFAKLGVSPKGIDGTRNSSASLLMNIATMFGLNIGNDEERYLYVLEHYVPKILKMSENHPRLNEVKHFFKIYTTSFTASSEHRFYPLVGVTYNILSGKDIFASLDNTLYQTVIEYMNSPRNPSFIIRDLPPYPPLTIDISAMLARQQENGTLKWLDIGSAFKSDGAPTLTVLQEAFPFLELYGDDISFPLFSLTDNGEIVRSKYVDEAAVDKILNSAPDAPNNPFKSEEIINGQHFLNGLNPQYSVFSDNFLPNQTFDFISICMTFHHLHTEDNANSKKTLSLTNKIIIDAHTGNELSAKQKTMDLFPSSQQVFERLLEHLDIGGLFFFNYINDAFYIFQRINENTYKLYTQHPVLFVPNNVMDYSPQNHKNPIPYDGLQKKLNLSDQQIKELREWFTLADKYNTRYQQWPESFHREAGQHPQEVTWVMWSAVRKVQAELSKVIEDKTKFDIKIFEEYLTQYIPEEIRRNLLATEIIREIKNITEIKETF